MYPLLPRPRPKDCRGRQVSNHPGAGGWIWNWTPDNDVLGSSLRYEGLNFVWKTPTAGVGAK